MARSFLQIEQIKIFSDNYVYFLRCSATGETVVVDPGQAQPVLNFLASKQWQLHKILCTHHHSDHIGGNLQIKKQTGCSIIGAKQDQKRIPGIDTVVCEGDTVCVGEQRARIMETWGHTIGHICFYFANNRSLFCGDTLFAAGCGRFFEGSPQQMYTSLQKLVALPQDTLVYCGHEYTLANIKFALHVDPENLHLQVYQQEVLSFLNRGKSSIPSVLANERKVNPFLRCHNTQIRKQLNMESASNVQVLAALREKKNSF